MACFSPLLAWQTESGDIVFAERGKIRRELKLPCGQCVGCRLERSRQWAMRCMHEAQLYDHNSFVTLTYDDDHVPEDNSLNYRHFQLFMKRLRKLKRGVRFYMCGEYGENYGRPHFHACLFNCDFEDKTIFRRLSGGSILYRSAELEALWPFGFSSIGQVTFESAAYVARYVMKKVTGRNQEKHYEAVDSETGEIFRRVPEFNHMSLRPGIGRGYYDRFYSDMYPRDYVVVRGMKMRPPKYYDRLMKDAENFDSDMVEHERYLRGVAFAGECTEERLAVREKVAKARVNLKVRTLK